MSTVQDHNSRWGRFNDWRCSGMFVTRFFFLVLFSEKYYGSHTAFILLYRMPWGVQWKLTPKLQDSFLSVITSAGKPHWLFAVWSTLLVCVLLLLLFFKAKYNFVHSLLSVCSDGFSVNLDSTLTNKSISTYGVIM